MALPGSPPLLDWRLQAALGVLAVAAAVWLLVSYRERLLVFGIAAWMLEVGLLIAGRGLLRPLLLPGRVAWLASYALALLPLVTGAGILSWRGWWQAAGFTPPSQWRRLRLLWLLGLFLILPMLYLLQGVRVGVSSAVMLAVYVVMSTGAEEMFYRGIVLRASIRYGVLPAALFSSLLFGVSHVNNLFTSYSLDPLFVLVQAWMAMLIGILFAAVRLRMNAIWPVMAAHAAYDLPALLVYGFGLVTQRRSLSSFLWATAFGLFFAAIGLFLLRRSQPSIIPTELKS